jgi:hypothetical protein
VLPEAAHAGSAAAAPSQASRRYRICNGLGPPAPSLLRVTDQFVAKAHKINDTGYIAKFCLDPLMHAGPCIKCAKERRNWAGPYQDAVPRITKGPLGTSVRNGPRFMETLRVLTRGATACLGDIAVLRSILRRMPTEQKGPLGCIRAPLLQVVSRDPCANASNKASDSSSVTCRSN